MSWLVAPANLIPRDTSDMEEFWRAHGEGPSSGLRRVAEEWWAMQRFPAIAFRDGVSGRRARLRGGPDVWEVVAVWRDYDPDNVFHHNQNIRPG